MACAIILLHAFVPHHHHDCKGEAGLVFETEVACHCHHDGCPEGDCGHSHHPFDMCKLAEMLSHLVISTKDDEATFAVMVKADVHELFGMAAVLPTQGGMSIVPMNFRRLDAFQAAVIPCPPATGGWTLRGPPCRVA